MYKSVLKPTMPIKGGLCNWSFKDLEIKAYGFGMPEIRKRMRDSIWRKEVGQPYKTLMSFFCFEILLRLSYVNLHNIRDNARQVNGVDLFCHFFEGPFLAVF